MSKREIQHESHTHPLLFCETVFRFDDEYCPNCRDLVTLQEGYYICSQGCQYYLHKKCSELRPESNQIHHPFHPSHPLIFHKKTPYNTNHFQCNFCQASRFGSSNYYHCDECDFYLDAYCSRYLLGVMRLQVTPFNYQIRHFINRNKRFFICPPEPVSQVENHECSMPSDGGPLPCAVCKVDILSGMTLKCSSCGLHGLLWSEMVGENSEGVGENKVEMEYPFHPQHTLITKEPSIFNFQKIQCNACLRDLNYAVHFLHCPKSCSFILCLVCAFLPTYKHDIHYHDLIHYDFDELIDLADAVIICTACKISCKSYFFRCFTCNFNIHSKCLELPGEVDDDDNHVHPLALISSFTENGSGKYYCDICEETRDPDATVYYCKECPEFVAHTYCVVPHLPMPEIVTNSSSPQKVEDNLDTTITESRESVGKKDASTSVAKDVSKGNQLVAEDVGKEDTPTNVQGEIKEVSLADLHNSVDSLKKILQELKTPLKNLGEKLMELEERHRSIGDEMPNQFLVTMPRYSVPGKRWLLIY